MKDSGSVEAAIISGAIIMFIALLGLAVQYGSLKQEVKGLKEDIADMKTILRSLQTLINAIVPNSYRREDRG